MSKDFVRINSLNSSFTQRTFPVPCTAGTKSIESSGVYWCPDQVVSVSFSPGAMRCHLIGSKAPSYYGVGIDDVYTHKRYYGGQNNANGATIYATTQYETFNTGSGATPALGAVNLETLVSTTFYKNDTSATAYGQVGAIIHGYTHSLTAGTGGRISQYAGNSVSISYNSSTYYVSGTRTYTAIADTGYKFASWTHNIGTASGGVLTVDCTAGDLVATANFVARKKITYDANGGSPTPSVGYANDAGNVTLANGANVPTKTGYEFAGWSIGGTVYDAGETIPLSSDVTATAVWKGTKSITTGFELEEGAPEQTPPMTISPAPTAANGTDWLEGTSVTITAPASGTGIVFGSWDASGVSGTGGTAANGSKTYSFTMPDNAVAITANYVLAPITISASIDSASSVAVAQGAAIEIVDAMTGDPFSGGHPVYGETARFTAPAPKLRESSNPSSGSDYSFSGWYVNGVKVSQDRAYTLTLTENVSLVAKYATTVVIEKELNRTSPSDQIDGSFSFDGTVYGSVSTASVSAELGSSHVIKAIPADGSYFQGWKVDTVLDESLYAESTVAIDGPHTYTAVFGELVYVEITLLNEKNSQSDSGNIGTLTLTGSLKEVESPSTNPEEDDDALIYTVFGFTPVTLIATQAESSPLPLFRIVEVVDGVEQVPPLSTTSPVSVPIARTARTFKAKWGYPAQFTVSVSVDGESSGMGIAFVGESQSATQLTMDQDTSVYVTALPANGYKFKEWQDGNGQTISGATSRHGITVTADIALVAVFEQDAVAIFAWEGSGENKTLEWTSKVYVLPKPFDPVAARVDATGYPVSLTVGTYSSPSAVPERDHTLSVGNQNGRRLARMRPERFMRVSVESNHEVDAVVVGTNMAEVN